MNNKHRQLTNQVSKKMEFFLFSEKFLWQGLKIQVIQLLQTDHAGPRCKKCQWPHPHVHCKNKVR